jgi:hypothetical protein
MEHDYEGVAKSSWDHLAHKPFHQKAKYLAPDLKKWRRTKPKLSNQLALVKDENGQKRTKNTSTVSVFIFLDGNGCGSRTAGSGNG